MGRAWACLIGEGGTRVSIGFRPGRQGSGAHCRARDLRGGHLQGILLDAARAARRSITWSITLLSHRDAYQRPSRTRATNTTSSTIPTPVEHIGFVGFRPDDGFLYLSKLYLVKEARGKGLWTGRVRVREATCAGPWPGAYQAHVRTRQHRESRPLRSYGVQEDCLRQQ